MIFSNPVSLGYRMYVSKIDAVAKFPPGSLK